MELGKVRLRIRDQNELLNQISGTYKDFFRAAMEYVDNSIDAAEALRRSGLSVSPVLEIRIDNTGRKVSFTDNCGGMSPDELSQLLSEVGRSKKKTVAWANGQFGFGVHSFRAFAKEAVFTSRKKDQQEARIEIDRDADEHTDVLLEATDGKQLEHLGTQVTISKFIPHVFNKLSFFRSLVSEIEHHFDDVLRAGLIRILVRSDNSRPYECKSFDFENMPGVALKGSRHFKDEADSRMISFELKMLERSQENRAPIITNKLRRIQSIADLKSYKNFLRTVGHSINVWQNPFVVGFVELNGICSPNLTRDDLKESPERERFFEVLFEIQKDLEAKVDEVMDRKVQDSYKKLGQVMSDCLSRILKSYRLQFEIPSPGKKEGFGGAQLVEEAGDNPFGGDEPGGGGSGPNNVGGGGDVSDKGKSGVGDDDSGAGDGNARKGDRPGDTAGETKSSSSGPMIDFQSHVGEDRVIDLGASIIINTQHPDFVKRNSGKNGKIKLEPRLINYVSISVAPVLVHRLFEKKGKVPTVLEAGANIVNLMTNLEQELNVILAGTEIER